MRHLNLLSASILCLAASSTLASVSRAQNVLTFEGLRNGESVASFYNGGPGGFGSGPGPNFGITFSSSALAFIDSDAGGTGNVGGEPSPDTFVAFPFASGMTLNAFAGFDTGFSFFYSAPNNPGVVRVYAGANASGSLLATLNLSTTPFNGAPDPTGQFSPFVATGVAFNGIARSVDFSGTPGQIVFDNITIGTSQPLVPEPATAGLLGAAGVLALLRRRR